MKYLFYLFFVIYWWTYFLPFASGRLGYEIEWMVWRGIMDHQFVLSAFITVWSLRSLMNALIIAVCFMRLTAIRQWLRYHVDVSFLYQLLCALVVMLLGYAFFMTDVRWSWGAMIWAWSTLFIVFSYYWIPNQPQEEIIHDGLEQHLVPLEEE